MDFTPEQIGETHEMLKSAGITDAMISRGVRLTTKGMKKLAHRYQCEADDISDLLRQVSDTVATAVAEDSERFSFEADFMGNITLRDSKTGREHFLQGDDAFKLEDQLSANPGQQQELIADYFDVTVLAEAETEADMVADAGERQNGGTFNFPYMGKFATASFWTDNAGFHVKVLSLRDSQNEEDKISPEFQKTLDDEAMKWVNRV